MLAATAKVRVSDHSFGLFDRFEIPVETADWSTGLVVEMASGAMVYTGVDRGHVQVTTQILGTAPDEIDPGPWDDIVEASVHAPHGELRVHQLEYGPTDTPPPLPLLSGDGPGTYRLRAHARGRDRFFDAVQDESNEDYLLTVWPAPPLPALIVRATDRCGYGLRLANLSMPRNRQPAVSVRPQAEQEQHDRLRQALLDGIARDGPSGPSGLSGPSGPSGLSGPSGRG